MERTFKAKALRDIHPFFKKDEIVTVTVTDTVTTLRRSVSSIVGTEVVDISKIEGPSFTNTDGNTYSYSQIKGIVGYIPISEVFTRIT